MSIRARKMLKMQFSFWFPAKIECVVYLSTSIHEPQHTLVKSALTILKFDFFLLIQVATHIIITQQFSEFRFAKAKWSNEWMKKEKKMKKKNFKFRLAMTELSHTLYSHLFYSLLLPFTYTLMMDEIFRWLIAKIEKFQIRWTKRKSHLYDWIYVFNEM